MDRSIPVPERRRRLHLHRRQRQPPLQHQVENHRTTRAYRRELKSSIATATCGLALLTVRSCATVSQQPVGLVRRFFTATISFMCLAQISNGGDGPMDGYRMDPSIPVPERRRLPQQLRRRSPPPPQHRPQPQHQHPCRARLSGWRTRHRPEPYWRPMEAVGTGLLRTRRRFLGVSPINRTSLAARISTTFITRRQL